MAEIMEPEDKVVNIPVINMFGCSRRWKKILRWREKQKTEKKDPNGTFREEKITVSKMKNILAWINSRLDIAKEKINISKHSNRNYPKQKRKKPWK